MIKREQKKLLRKHCNTVLDKLLAHSNNWPKEWDGHELRALAAKAFEEENRKVMHKDNERRSNFDNEWVVRDLY